MTDGLPAARVAIETLERGYSDYPVRLDFGSFLPSMFAVGDADPDLCVTGWHDQRVAGVALGARRGERARLAAIAVDPEHRRRGIGRALCLRLAERAAEAGAQVLVLEVLTDNTRALDLYVSLGFEHRRRLVGFERARGGTPVDRAELRAAREDRTEPPSWQLAAVVDRVLAAGDPTEVAAVVPEGHAVARVLRDQGFRKSDLDQVELEKPLVGPESPRSNPDD